MDKKVSCNTALRKIVQSSSLSSTTSLFLSRPTAGISRASCPSELQRRHIVEGNARPAADPLRSSLPLHVRHPFSSTRSEAKGLPLSTARTQKLPDAIIRFLGETNLKALIYRSHATSKRERSLACVWRPPYDYLESGPNQQKYRLECSCTKSSSKSRSGFLGHPARLQEVQLGSAQFDCEGADLTDPVAVAIALRHALGYSPTSWLGSALHRQKCY